ncbi:MAG TPA: SPFH domain-containing protein [Jiangellaceae bacterium]|nr:SPFH domain-containing protein [Jiangellaceae bacterium]
MADIRNYGIARHLRGTPTGYVVHQRKGRLVHQGTGQSFWFRPLTAVLSEIPVDDRELPLLFHARTADFQDVTVQATVTYRFGDPSLVATRMDFAIDPGTGHWQAGPLDQAAHLLTELAQQHALDLLATMPLTAALSTGLPEVRARMRAGLGEDTRLQGTGIAVLDVRVVALRPEADMERALQTPTREQVQQEADRATFERRALAVERERAISENELQSQIELATREERLVEQRGANDRRRATEKAAAARISTDAEAEQTRIKAQAQADRTRLVGAADAEAEAARMAVVAAIDRQVLLALALRELAGQLPNIGTLNLTPDLLTGAFAQLTGRTG